MMWISEDVLVECHRIAGLVLRSGDEDCPLGQGDPLRGQEAERDGINEQARQQPGRNLPRLSAQATQ